MMSLSGIREAKGKVKLGMARLGYHSAGKG